MLAIMNILGLTPSMNHLRLRLTLLLSACMAAIAHAESGDLSTRYVWANTLILRAEPDAKGAELARLPFGSKVTLMVSEQKPIDYQLSLLKLEADDEHAAVDVILKGHWQRVHVGNMDAWVVDTYLSRYPTPQKLGTKDEGVDLQLALMEKIFGGRQEWHWKTGDATKGDAFHLMQQRNKLKPEDIKKDLSWDFVKFGGGAIYEFLGQNTGEMYFNHSGFKALPFTFNEAVLWLKAFGGLDSSNGRGMGKFVGKFEPGKRLELLPAPSENPGVAIANTIECDATTCSILQDVAD